MSSLSINHRTSELKAEFHINIERLNVFMSHTEATLYSGEDFSDIYIYIYIYIYMMLF